MSRTTTPLKAARLATPADAEALVRLVNSAYRGEGAKQGWTTEADLLGGQRIDVEGARAMVSRPHQYVFVWESNDRPGDFDACVNLEDKGDTGYLGMLTVRPDLQNAGYGRQMLAHAEEFFLGRGLKRIEMTVISTREELVNWYLRRGYVLTAETRAFPTDPRFGIPKVAHLEFVVLEKHLR